MTFGQVHLTVFDFVAIAIVGVSIVIGLTRGALRELLSLIAWVVSFLVAKDYAGFLVPMLPDFIPNPTLRLIVAFGAVFAVTLLVIKLVSVAFSALLQRVGLGPVDRLLGSVIGLMRGVLIMLILVLFAGLTTLPGQPEWYKAMSSSWFENLAMSTKVWLPEGMSKRIHYDHDIIHKTSFNSGGSPCAES